MSPAGGAAACHLTLGKPVPLLACHRAVLGSVIHVYLIQSSHQPPIWFCRTLCYTFLLLGSMNLCCHIHRGAATVGGAS